MNVENIKKFVSSLNEDSTKSVGAKAVKAMLKDIIKDYEHNMSKFRPSSIAVRDIITVDIGPCRHYAIVIYVDADNCLVLPITTDSNLPFTSPFFSRILRVEDEEDPEIEKQQYISLIPIAIPQCRAINRFVGILDDYHDITVTVDESRNLLRELYDEIVNSYKIINSDEQDL